MAQEINEMSELLTYIRQLKRAVTTTTCEKMVDALRQMLSEAEAKRARRAMLACGEA